MSQTALKILQYIRRQRRSHPMNRLTREQIVKTILKHQYRITTPEGFLKILAGRINPRHEFEKILLGRFQQVRYRYDRPVPTAGEIFKEFDRQIRRSQQGLPNGIDCCMPDQWDQTEERIHQRDSIYHVERTVGQRYRTRKLLKEIAEN